MVPFVEKLSKCVECFMHVYSNAGLPNAMGGYDDTPDDMAKQNEVFFKNGWLNITSHASFQTLRVPKCGCLGLRT
jgi:5-methyltetrahydrofolate--homocysteine methyltransferase